MKHSLSFVNTTCCLWCLLLNLRNRNCYQYLCARPGSQSTLPDPSIDEGHGPYFYARKDTTSIALVRNYVFAALVCVTWYLQFFFYPVGGTEVGGYKDISWTLHMASIIYFSSIGGITLVEWKGSGRKFRRLLADGLLLLVLSTVVIGMDNYPGTGSGGSH